MARTNNAFIKKQKELLRKKKKEEKEKRKEDRRKNPGDGSLESMMAYVDEFGNITSTPPEKKK